MVGWWHCGDKLVFLCVFSNEKQLQPPAQSTYTDKEPTTLDTGRMRLDFDQGMTTTSLPPFKGKLSSCGPKRKRGRGMWQGASDSTSRGEGRHRR